MSPAPVRLCCGQRHFGVQCPDGLVQCCLCFDRVEVSGLAVEDGALVNICQACMQQERNRT